MELVIFVLGLVALAVLAARYGHDSRDALTTSERELARRGVTWDDLEAGSGSGDDRPDGIVTPAGRPCQETRTGTRPAGT